MYKTLSERVAYVVKQSRLNQTDFAARISISQQYLSQICNGRKTPSDRTISDICREFGCNEAWLRTGEGEPEQKRTRQEEIMRFAVQTYKSDDEFRKAFVAMLAKLDPEDWQALNKIADKLLEEYNKSGQE